MVVAGPSFLFIHEIFNNRYNELEEKACMKKLFIILILFFVSGCSNIKTKDEYKDGITISSMNEIPDITELVDLKADIDAKAMVDGNKIIISTIEDKPKEVEIPITFNTMNIDGTQDVDLSLFYSDAEKLSGASYTLNEDRSIMTITDSEKSFDVPVNVIYPKFTIASDIVIDTYTGYDVHDFVSCDAEGVEITSVLDEEESQIIISLKKGIWDVSEIKDVTLINSNPYPIVYRGTVDQHNMDISYMTFTIVDEENAVSYSEKVDVTFNYKKVSDNTYELVWPFYNSVFGNCIEICTVVIDGNNAKETSVISENGGPYKTNTTFDGTPCCSYYVLENE